MKGMSPIVQTVTRWIRAFIVLFGIYVICYGHISPGGGFAGGVVIACGFILLMLALGREACERRYSIRWAGKLDAVGALAFAAVALLGFAAGLYFQNFLGRGESFQIRSAGSIPLGNFAIGLKVSASLFLVVAVLSVLRVAARRPPATEAVKPAETAETVGPEDVPAAGPEAAEAAAAAGARQVGIAPPRAPVGEDERLPRAWARKRRLPTRRRGLGGRR